MHTDERPAIRSEHRAGAVDRVDGGETGRNVDAGASTGTAWAARATRRRAR
jgi:hypothetical protein